MQHVTDKLNEIIEIQQKDELLLNINSSGKKYKWTPDYIQELEVLPNNSELMSSGSVRVSSSNDFVTTVNMGRPIPPKPTLVNEYLSLVQKEREDLVVVGTSLKGQTNADGLNKVLLQLVSTVQDVNTTLADAKATNKELIAVKKSGIYPLFSGVLLGMFLLTLAKFLIKGTFF